MTIQSHCSNFTQRMEYRVIQIIYFDLDSIDIEINDRGWTGLMFSAYYHLPKAVDFFIEKGADVHKTNSVGWNALFLFCLNEKYKEVCGTCFGCFLHKDTKTIFCDNHFKMLRIGKD